MNITNAHDFALGIFVGVTATTAIVTAVLNRPPKQEPPRPPCTRVERPSLRLIESRRIYDWEVDQ